MDIISAASCGCVGFKNINNEIKFNRGEKRKEKYD